MSAKVHAYHIRHDPWAPDGEYVPLKSYSALKRRHRIAVEALDTIRNMLSTVPATKATQLDAFFAALEGAQRAKGK